MKKFYYYVTLVGIFLVVWMALVINLALILEFTIPFPFGYRFGAALAHPQLLIFSIGLVLLSRNWVYRIYSDDKDKKFSNIVAIACIVVATIWFLLNFAGRIINKNAVQKVLELQAPPSEGRFKVGDVYYSIVSSDEKTCEVTYLHYETDSNKDAYIGDITIPSTVTNNGIKYTVIGIGEDAFYMCEELTGVSIPNSITYIGSVAFQSCTGLTELDVPESVTEIGSLAFRFCSGLKNVAIPKGVTKIESSVFEYCTGLTSITIPESVTSIGYAAFNGCSVLTEITIPNSVTSIDLCAFYDCTTLKKLFSANPIPPTCEDFVFENLPTECILYVPKGSKEAYSAAEEWCDFYNIVEIE